MLLDKYNTKLDNNGTKFSINIGIKPQISNYLCDILKYWGSVKNLHTAGKKEISFFYFNVNCLRLVIAECPKGTNKIHKLFG